MINLKDFEIGGEPHFCVITPTTYLEEYATQSHTHLVLAHIVDTNPTYAAFYKKMSDRGDRVIMDNGAFELGGSYAPSKLVELGHRINADALVLPDYPGVESIKTVNAAIKLIPQFKDEGFKTMFVPQSVVDDLEDWISAYEWARENPDIDIIGMSILGIPNALPHIPKSYARVVMTQLLLDRSALATKFHHYLGLNSAPNVEIPALIKMDALDSCDSSGPVWAAICGHRYNTTGDSFLPVHKKYLREVDFNEPWSKKDHIHEAIQYNLDVTFDIFKYPSNYI
ncbi:hypothetical protein M0R04_07380 [Candidatus Dojkabacteria bacterium]|jgi:hypothetical protein|nr:hypothetical protein [Candidatus Dojkabacteria bacterium]